MVKIQADGNACKQSAKKFNSTFTDIYYKKAL